MRKGKITDMRLANQTRTYSSDTSNTAENTINSTAKEAKAADK